MTIILRLQGLDVKAGTEDIRAFFEGLHIPDGGVYIVGGHLREAFIAFTTERNAQLAMRYTDHFLKGSKIILQRSSMAELEEKLKSSLKRKNPSPMQPTVKRPRLTTDVNVLPLNAHPLNPNTANLPQPLNPGIENLPIFNAQSLDSNTAFLLGVCTVLQSLQSENSVAVPRVDFPKADRTQVCEETRTQKQTLDLRPGYVRLFGLPASTTKEDICHFFKGLTVQEAIVDVELGRSHICLVKFATRQDECDALLFNQQSLGSICVEVRGATEKMWTSALQECETTFVVRKNAAPTQSPPGGTVNVTEKNYSSRRKRRANQLTSKSPKRPRSAPTMEYIVMVTNIPKSMTKTEIKELFECPDVPHHKVKHLIDKDSVRTSTVFLIFKRIEDYEYAMNLTGCHVGSDTIEVSSITKQIMLDIMSKSPYGWRKQCPKKMPNRKRKSNPFETPEETPIVNPVPAAKTCLFVRNMPADVQKGPIQELFSKYRVRENDIISLHDSDGKSIGEAVVQFKSQKLAVLAQRLHGQDFLGAKVLLTLINVTQLEDILVKNVSGN